MKNFYIFKNYKTKTYIKLFNYHKNKLILQDFFFKNNNKNSLSITYTS